MSWDADDVGDVDDEWDPDLPWIIGGDDYHMVELALPDGVADALRSALSDDAFVSQLRAVVERVTFLGDDNMPVTAADVDRAVAASFRLATAALDGAQVDEVQLTEAADLLLALTLARFDGPDAGFGDLEGVDRWVDALDRLAANCHQMLLLRFRPRRDGSFRLKLRVAERAMVADALADLRRALSSDDAATTRLFPSPYGDDAEQNAAWGLLARGELMDRRLAALDRVDAMMDRSTCTADELSDLMRCINDARLVLGTRLDVSETGPPPDMSPDDAAAYAAYEQLGGLLEHAVLALRTTLGRT